MEILTFVDFDGDDVLLDDAKGVRYRVPVVVGQLPIRGSHETHPVAFLGSAETYQQWWVAPVENSINGWPTHSLGPMPELARQAHFTRIRNNPQLGYKGDLAALKVEPSH